MRVGSGWEVGGRGGSWGGWGRGLRAHTSEVGVGMGLRGGMEGGIGGGRKRDRFGRGPSSRLKDTPASASPSPTIEPFGGAAPGGTGGAAAKGTGGAAAKGTGVFTTGAAASAGTAGAAIPPAGIPGIDAGTSSLTGLTKAGSFLMMPVDKTRESMSSMSHVRTGHASGINDMQSRTWAEKTFCAADRSRRSQHL